MNLEQLTAGMPELVKITGNAQTEIKALTADSRAKCEDGLFFCIRGGRVDAHDFAPQAVAGGCVALVVERELAIDCPQVVVTDVRAKSVVICTGGFLGNTQMQQEHFNTPVFPLGNTVSDGTGIQMVLNAGGVLDRPFAVLGNECGAVSPATEGWPFTPEWRNVNEHYGYWLFGGLYVDGTGSRFINEGRVAELPLAVGGEAIVRAGKAFVIMDSAYYNACQNEGIYAYLGEPAEWTAGEEAGYYNPSAENAEAHLQQAIDEGWGCKADTIEEIAETFGLDNLVQTVEAYNEMCDSGEDTEFYKPAYFLSPVKEPPFYAFEYVPSAWGTNGGVKVDSCLRALDAENNAIPGLYVAGVDTGSMYTMPYYTNPGASVGNAMGSGWAVAEQIAKGLA